jgi:ubiquitin C-terminal hydrolase
LTLSLNRFEFDYDTMARKKVNDKFAYPLELNLADYLDAEAIEEPENTHYELKAILIHSGGAFGGHYHAYVNYILINIINNIDKR